MPDEIKISILTDPQKIPQRTDANVFFGYKSKYKIELTKEGTGAKTIHCGAEGCSSIEQIKEDFALIIAHLEEQAKKAQQ